MLFLAALSAPEDSNALQADTHQRDVREGVLDIHIIGTSKITSLRTGKELVRRWLLTNCSLHMRTFFLFG